MVQIADAISRASEEMSPKAAAVLFLTTVGLLEPSQVRGRKLRLTRDGTAVEVSSDVGGSAGMVPVIERVAEALAAAGGVLSPADTLGVADALTEAQTQVRRLGGRNRLPTTTLEGLRAIVVAEELSSERTL